ncbi:MAG: hypothetical protein J6U54_11560 [Clostridiales bacterium]|nr:hypothetical protein [Clostridiales bacterium]
MEQGKQPVQLTKEQIIGMVIKNLGDINCPISLYDQISVPIINAIENLFAALELCGAENKKMHEILAENEAYKSLLESQKATTKAADEETCKDQLTMDLEEVEEAEEVEEENQNGT